MTVISFASSKGGAGKTTSAIVLATTLARRGDVLLIDGDPARRLMSWAEAAELPKRLQVWEASGEQALRGALARARRKDQIIIVDLEGIASRTNAYAMSQSDLVIVPMGEDRPDAEGAIETLGHLALVAQEQSEDMEIPVRILFSKTRTTAKSRFERDLNAQVRDKIGSFEVELIYRAAFKTLYDQGGSLYGIDRSEVSGVDKAIANAEAFAAEVKAVLDCVDEIRSSKDRKEVRHEA